MHYKQYFLDEIALHKISNKVAFMYSRNNTTDVHF